jgi:hypothetical protein
MFPVVLEEREESVKDMISSPSIKEINQEDHAANQAADTMDDQSQHMQSIRKRHAQLAHYSNPIKANVSNAILPAWQVHNHTVGNPTSHQHSITQ